ncbi:MAG: thiamine diphosphokinase [Fidelibacterota bacterium]
MFHQQPQSPYCLLLGNGAYPESSVCKRLIAGANLLVCCDGGANYAFQNGITPHLIIGDLDSIHDDVQNHFAIQKIPFITLKSQERNDLEKSLQYIKGHHSCTYFVLLGFLGFRDDHSYATLQIIEKQETTAQFQIFSKTAEYLFLPPGRYQFQFPVNQHLSLFPAPIAENLTTGGLKWNLFQETLAGGSRGLSNVVTRSDVQISFDNGKLLLIHPFIS